jgi:hypothetical protein
MKHGKTLLAVCVFLYVLATALDVGTTVYALGLSGIVESNPLAVWAMANGLFGLLVIGDLFLFAVVPLLCWFVRSRFAWLRAKWFLQVAWFFLFLAFGVADLFVATMRFQAVGNNLGVIAQWHG